MTIITWIITVAVVVFLLPVILSLCLDAAFWIVSTINNIRYGPEWNEDGTPNIDALSDDMKDQIFKRTE